MTRPKHGGRRSGAGRKPGGSNALPKGFVAAVKALNHRLPEDAPDELKAVGARAFQRLVDVMEERVGSFNAGNVLKAATMLREEICGPLAQKHQHAGPDGGALEVVIHSYADEEEENGRSNAQPAAVD